MTGINLTNTPDTLPTPWGVLEAPPLRGLRTPSPFAFPRDAARVELGEVWLVLVEDTFGLSGERHIGIGTKTSRHDACWDVTFPDEGCSDSVSNSDIVRLIERYSIDRREVIEGEDLLDDRPGNTVIDAKGLAWQSIGDRQWANYLHGIRLSGDLIEQFGPVVPVHSGYEADEDS